jgi:hypothetical protein
MDTLNKLWQAWKRFGQIIGNFVGRVILSLFYFTVFVPFGVGATFFGDVLKLKENQTPYWLSRETPEVKLEDARRQF